MSQVHVLPARAAARGFAGAVNRVQYAGARVVLTRRGEPVAALVSMEDLARLDHALDLSELSSDRLRELEAIFDEDTAAEAASP